MKIHVLHIQYLMSVKEKYSGLYILHSIVKIMFIHEQRIMHQC